MVENTFSMSAQKAGRMKYLLLVMGIPLLFMFLLAQLIAAGILPPTKILVEIITYIPALMMIALGYPLVFKKNHTIEVDDYALLETDWRGRKHEAIKTEQISSYRQNILGEIILLDENRKPLLCVESNMTNFDAFQQWLVRHDILDNKEK